MQDGKNILNAPSEPTGRKTRVFEQARIAAFVDGFLQRRETFLQTSRRCGSPLYVLEEDILHERAVRFTETFRRALGDVGVYYAMKSNNSVDIVKTLVEAGLGMDVSSGGELQAALELGSNDIVFSGPGKTDEELSLAIENRDRTKVLMDSFGELERLDRLAGRKGAVVRTGVRLTTDENGLWRKFGIPLRDLPRFMEAAVKCSGVSFCGLQFHTSWNLDPTNQVNFISRLGETLGKIPPALRSLVKFIDIGGGFWPEQGEWMLSPDGSAPSPVAGVAQGRFRHPSTAIEDFAGQIAAAVRDCLLPHVSCRICAEPGRWICNDAMHLILTVIDKKAPDLVITDGGTNIIGWERFETDYFPVINLSRPELIERPCHVLGSLCTPHDVWGYAYWGRDIRAGDTLLIPTQGAYTYSLRQEFIKPLPKTAIMDKPA